jgi:exosortase
MDHIITMLRVGSTDVAYSLLKLTGTPVSRDGYLIFFPEMIVEVAEECSGIRSSMALFLTSLVSGYMFLKKPWKRIVLLLMVVPISVLRNGLRILILSLLGMYVDISFVGDNIAHRRGGVFFFALSVLLLFSVLWLLRDRKARH